jgi:surfeit locus 1 family protein
VNGSRRIFQPPVWATIGLVLSCSLFITAGFWQLDRRDQKQRLFDDFDAGDRSGPIAELVSSEIAGRYRFQFFSVQGVFDTQHQILLDNVQYQGRNGYSVMTPLRTDHGNVLVNRGWIPANADRTIIPDISTSTDLRTITGRLNLLPVPGIRLEAPLPDPTTPWPRRLLYPTGTEIGLQLGYEVFDYQLLLDESSPDGYVRDFRPTWADPTKHFGYAMQWFGFAVTMLVIYIVVNFKQSSGPKHGE